MEIYKTGQSSDDCEFCKEISGNKSNQFLKLYEELGSRFIYESNRFKIMPCIGQLANNHCLLITKHHMSTIGDSTLLKGGIEEIDGLLGLFCKDLILPGQKLLMFEHGASCPEHGGCGIYHAHLHLLPIDKDLNLAEIYGFKNGLNFSSLNEALVSARNTTPYVLLGCASDGFGFEPLSNPLPSQTLRRRVAATLGLEMWDWRMFGRQESFANTINSISALQSRPGRQYA